MDVSGKRIRPAALRGRGRAKPVRSEVKTQGSSEGLINSCEMEIAKNPVDQAKGKKKKTKK